MGKSRLATTLYCTSLRSSRLCSAYRSVHNDHNASAQVGGDSEAYAHAVEATGAMRRSSELDQLARSSQASEMASFGFYLGQQRMSKTSRPDLKYFVDAEQENLRDANEMVLRYRARPSLLQPACMALGYTIGMVSSLGGRNVSLAAAGAMRDVALEHYNDAMRNMMESGNYEQEETLRKQLKQLRDADRAPEDSPRAPSIEALANPKELTAMDAVGATVRGLTEIMLGASRRL